jgi:hypothetical protein
VPKKKHRLCADSPLPDEADLPPFLCGFGTAFPLHAHSSIRPLLFRSVARRLVFKDSVSSTDAGLPFVSGIVLAYGPASPGRKADSRLKM